MSTHTKSHPERKSYSAHLALDQASIIDRRRAELDLAWPAFVEHVLQDYFARRGTEFPSKYGRSRSNGVTQ